MTYERKQARVSGMNKIVLIIGAVVVVLGVGILLRKKSGGSAEIAE